MEIARVHFSAGTQYIAREQSSAFGVKFEFDDVCRARKEESLLDLVSRARPSHVKREGLGTSV